MTQDARPLLTLAHSGDPDDAFMWWPITGKVRPDGTPLPGDEGRAKIDTGRFRFRAIPGDIETFNRRASAHGDYDVTALSVRAWADCRKKYVITHCGSSFGEGYGPKLVAAKYGRAESVESLRDQTIRIAVPGKRTTAFLVMGLLLGKPALANDARFIEMPFEKIIPAVAAGEVDAGLIIHEGQVTYTQDGLVLLEDLGRWWKQTRNLPLPLGVNAVRRDIEARFGEGALAELSAVLRRSIEHALAHRAESLAYTLPFAAANAASAGASEPSLQQVDHYVSLYVTLLTQDLRPHGITAISRLLKEGHAAGLCADPGTVDVI